MYDHLSDFHRLVISNISSSLKFLQRFPDMPVIVWCDLMKCGRLSSGEVDEYATLLSHILHSRYKSCVGIVIAPFLVSEKHGGYRGQIRWGGVEQDCAWWVLKQ